MGARFLRPLLSHAYAYVSFHPTCTITRQYEQVKGSEAGRMEELNEARSLTCRSAAWRVAKSCSSLRM